MGSEGQVFDESVSHHPCCGEAPSVESVSHSKQGRFLSLTASIPRLFFAERRRFERAAPFRLLRLQC